MSGIRLWDAYPNTLEGCLHWPSDNVKTFNCPWLHVFGVFIFVCMGVRLCISCAPDRLLGFVGVFSSHL